MNENIFKEKLRGILRLPASYDGFTYRMVAQRYATRHDIISIVGSIRAGGRYNFKGAFGILYTATNVHTCTEEAVQATRAKEADVIASLPRTLIGIRVRLSRVLDLTNPSIRKRLGIKKKILTHSDWEHEQEVLKREAITHIIARLAREVGFEALLVPSAVWMHGTNLNIFPDRLQPGSILQAENTNELKLKV
jgi:RES domain-containing protein